MIESEFTALVTKTLRSQGAVVHINHASTYSVPGVPDRIVWHKKWCGWIECKGLNTRVTPRQYHEINQLNMRRPGTAVVVRLVDHKGSKTTVMVDGGEPIELQDLLDFLARLLDVI